MPELPAARRERYMREIGLTTYEAQVLTAEREVSDYFEAVIPGLNTRPPLTG